MSNETRQEAGGGLPLYPTQAPDLFTDREATKKLFEAVLSELAAVVDRGGDALDAPTPCRGFTVGQLRTHVLGWLQFFAAALADPSGETERLDPATWELGADQTPSAIVAQAALTIADAIDGGVAKEVVVMSQARMAGTGVLAMALGEYLIHGWDLATATASATWRAAEGAAEPALAFLQTTVAPEHRGPDSGFFDTEVTAPPGADGLQRLLCFSGRDPNWAPELPTR